MNPAISTVSTAYAKKTSYPILSIKAKVFPIPFFYTYKIPIPLRAGSSTAELGQRKKA